MPSSMTSMHVAESDLQRIQHTALKILSDLGVSIGSREMCERLAGIGCRISDNRVYMTPDVVESTIRAIPRRFKLYDRSGESFVTVDVEGPCLCTNTGILPSIYDLESGSLRRAIRRDVEWTTRILDALSEVDIVYVSLVDATDVSPHMITLVDFAETLFNTAKPLLGPGATSGSEARAIVNTALALRNGSAEALMRKPPCAPFVVANTPLNFPEQTVNAVEELARSGLPLSVCTNPIMGATAPYTIAGAVALGHAEVLAAAVMAHSIRRGLPIVNFSSPTIADMHSLASISNSPETGMIRSLIVQLSNFLGIPAWGHADNCSSWADEQASDEKTINAMIIADARPSLLGGLGGLGNVTVASYETLLMDNERFSAIRRYLKGVNVDEDHLAYPVIADMVSGQSILLHAHTLEYIRSCEVWQPRLAKRRGIIAGMPEKCSMKEAARDEAKALIAGHAGEPLPGSIKDSIREVMTSYDSEMRGSLKSGKA